MASPLTLTTESAQALYEQRLGICEGLFVFTTRTALYDWNNTAQRYERLEDGLRVRHVAGAQWNARLGHFVRCRCRWCAAHPELVRATDLY